MERKIVHETTSTIPRLEASKVSKGKEQNPKYFFCDGLSYKMNFNMQTLLKYHWNFQGIWLNFTV